MHFKMWPIIFLKLFSINLWNSTLSYYKINVFWAIISTSTLMNNVYSYLNICLTSNPSGEILKKWNCNIIEAFIPNDKISKEDRLKMPSGRQLELYVFDFHFYDFFILYLRPWPFWYMKPSTKYLRNICFMINHIIR